MNIPSFQSYGDYSSSNYGVNCLRFNLPNGISFYYSYSTIVAFSSPFTGLIVHENDWSTTTGKHLNWIDGGNKKNRLNDTEFNIRLAHMLAHYGLDTEKKERLEYLRGELRAARMSYGELAELQELIPYIEEGDTELLEAAGVPEHPEEKSE